MKILIPLAATLFLTASLFPACNKNRSFAPPPPSVYVGGNGFSLFQGPDTALYWKNGTRIPLTDDSKEAMVTGICVSGNNVYVAGYAFNSSGARVATYWKNGSPVSLTDSTRTAYATGIAVSGNNVYVAGYDVNTSGIAVAKYWRNGSPVPLADATAHSAATCIVVK
jgi:hypothetical protein